MELSELDLLAITANLRAWSNTHLHLVVLIQKHFDLEVRLLQLGLRDWYFSVDPCDLAVLLIKNILKLFLQLLLIVFEVLWDGQFQLFFFFVKLFDPLVQHFDVEFQLLLNFDVVSYLSLVLLKLLLVLFWG
jgi:hypothetical protein